MKHRIVIGVDASYSCTGVSAIIDRSFKHIGSIDYSSCSNHTEIRRETNWYITELIKKCDYNHQNADCVVVVERPRVKKGKIINESFLRNMGGMLYGIVDSVKPLGVNTYTVDARAWKADIVGTCKPQQNKYGIDPNKYPTIRYINDLGYLKEIIYPYDGKGKKGVLTFYGKRYKVNDNAADSACIALYGYKHFDDGKLKLEE